MIIHNSKMPIIFHSLKHHLTSLKQLVTANKMADINQLLPQIKTLGESTFDMYTGLINTETIIEETTQYLSSLQVYQEPHFKLWIATNNGFRLFEISDETNMTLRYLPQQQYIHLHPSRYSKNTIRIKANAMKTAVALHVINLQPNTTKA
ncbi:MAG: hypothetical protein JHD28_12095, partial [Bacteroidia bacterium]|nr:hypothetical protein [Bacteroidia bacterium]